jgi:lysozyme
MISKAGIDLVKRFEGCKLKAYLCPAGVPTIGWGETGKHVFIGLTVTQEQADEWLMRSLAKANAALHRLVNCPLKQCQEDALTSFVYNCGAFNFEQSTLRKRVNCGKIEEAAEEFGKWVNGDGKKLPGLVRRRAAERAMFEGKP